MTTLKHRIAQGIEPVGTMVFEFFVPGMAQMARACGADFLLYDMEHSGIGIETIKAQCAACAGSGVAPLVRVPSHQFIPLWCASFSRFGVRIGVDAFDQGL